MALLIDALRRNADEAPDHPAVIDGDRVVTYAALWRDVRRLAARIGACTPERARVGILLPNSLEAVRALYGVFTAGRIAVPLDVDAHPRNQAHVLEDCGVSLVLTSQALAARCGGIEAQPRARFVPIEDAEAGAARPSDEPRAGDSMGTALQTSASDPLDIACILFTTGTTGRRKGVMLSHANLLAATANMNAFMRPGPWTVESLPMPLSHSFGFARLRSVFAVGGTVLVEEGFVRVGRLFKGMMTHGANALAAVPAAFAILLERYLEPFRAIGPQLRLIEIGSAPMPERHREALMACCPNARICMHYGLTEASRATFLDFRADAGFLDTAGRPAPNVRVRIAGEGGHDAGPGTPGEILVQGRMVASGYWSRPDLTAAAIVGGWLHTGDQGFLDAGGYLHVVGRTEDVLNIGGTKIAAAEIEDRLKAFDGVVDAAVTRLEASAEVPVPGVKAWLVVRPHGTIAGFRALREHCLRELEPYKVPREFEIVDALPRTPSGKLQRHLLGRPAPPGP